MIRVWVKTFSSKLVQILVVGQSVHLWQYVRSILFVDTFLILGGTMRCADVLQVLIAESARVD